MICPNCGRENPVGFRLCGCDAAAAAVPGRQERKTLTVLFADLVGFTSRSEQMDPEDVRALLGPYWERLREELERRWDRGEVHRRRRGGALRRARRARGRSRASGPRGARHPGLAAEESELHVRIGINTGEALVALERGPRKGEGMALGATS